MAFANITVKSCTAKGKRCTALDGKNNKWLYDAISEWEADMMADAVNDRGWITDQWWRKA